MPLYIVLADFGYFSKELFNSFEEFGNPLTMRPDMKKVPGIEFSTGSMGHGLPVVTEIALAAKIKKLNYRSVVLVGDEVPIDPLEEKWKRSLKERENMKQQLKLSI